MFLRAVSMEPNIQCILRDWADDGENDLDPLAGTGHRSNANMTWE